MNINKNEYRKILIKMSFPILMNYIVMTLFEIIDKAIVGNYSTEGFAAISVAASFIFGITGAIGVLSAAFNIIAAQLIGKGDNKKFFDAFLTTMSLSFIIGIIVIVLAIIEGRNLFAIVYGLTGNVLELALQYFYISSSTVLLNMIIFNYSVYFRNMKNTKISFYSTVVSTVVNIMFDYILVYGKMGFPELGVKGAAIGSVLGLLMGCLVFLYYCKGDMKRKIYFDKVILIKLIKLYIPLFGQEIVEGTLFVMILTGIVSRLGTKEIASYALLESFSNIMSLPIFALSSAAVTLAVQKSFSKDEEDSRNILNTAIRISIFMVMTIGIVIRIYPNRIFGLITSDTDVIKRCIVVFIFVIIGQIINTFTIIYKSYLQGINYEGFVFKWTSIISLLSIVWILVFVKIFSLLGIYIGIVVNNLILTFIYFYKIRKSVSESNILKVGS